MTEVKGTSEVLANLRQAMREAGDGAVRGLDLATQHLLAASTAVAPLDEGTMIHSAKATVDEASMTAAVSYDTVYAVRQHEELTWRHDPGRQAKYLEEPAAREAETMTAILAQQVREALGTTG